MAAARLTECLQVGHVYVPPGPLVVPVALIRPRVVPLLVHAGPVGTGTAPVIAVVAAAGTAAPVAATSRLRLGGGVRYVHRHAFDYVVFAAETLGYFRVEEGDETERAERFRDEHVGDLAVLPKVLAEVVGGQFFSAAAYEDFARHLLDQAFLKTTKTQTWSGKNHSICSINYIRSMHNQNLVFLKIMA